MVVARDAYMGLEGDRDGVSPSAVPMAASLKPANRGMFSTESVISCPTSS